MGSSPHTRGLLVTTGFRGLSPGIIPAHAGFTTETLENQPKTTDHPRTRGVYLLRSCPEGPSPGSSPHTRGYDRNPRKSTQNHGSSPHTRGLRGGRRPVRCCAGDHPRTRGVYLPQRPQTPQKHGSSPHTRGLLEAHLDAKLRGWIIPAHAGFTGSDCGLMTGSPDHPRTRGVYR